MYTVNFLHDLQVKSFSSDGKTLYFADWKQPACARDVDAGLQLQAFDRKPRRASRLAASADNRRLAIVECPEYPTDKGARDVITVWDMTARRELYQLLPPAGADVRDLALGPDGTYLAAVGEVRDIARGIYRGFLEVWDTRTGKECLLRTDFPHTLTALTFSGDGRSLAVGTERGALTLWEVATQLERHRFAGHENRIEEITFSRGDKFLATTSCDAPIFIWDVEGNDGQPPSAEPLSTEERTRLWQALNVGEAPAAFDAMRKLLARPGPVVALLREQLKPAPAISVDGIRKLLRDLDADNFAIRDRASVELEMVADRAVTDFQQALKEKPSAEVQRRIGQLLESAEPGGSWRRREVRAVEVLERIGSNEARELLASLAHGADGALLTREARSAVKRLNGK
jgi:WD40 repeat protein